MDLVGCQEVKESDVSKYGIVKPSKSLDEKTVEMYDEEKVLAYNFDGKRYDIGNKFGLLKANIKFGLRNEETKEELLKYIKNI